MARDRDRHCGRGSATVVICNGVSERVSGRFTDSQTFKLSVWIVAERSVVIVRDDASGFAIIETEGMRIVCIQITEVSTNSRRWSIFIGPTTDCVGNRIIVLAGDRDRYCGRLGATVAIIDGVSERVSGRFIDCQTFELSIRIVAEGSIFIVRDHSDSSGSIHTEGMRIARIHITEVGIDSRDWSIFIGPTTDCICNRCIILARDRDRDRGR